MDNPFRIQQQAEAVRRMVRDTARNRMGLPPVWTDDTTPRTDRPVRFYWGQVGEETGEWEADAPFLPSRIFA